MVVDPNPSVGQGPQGGWRGHRSSACGGPSGSLPRSKSPGLPMQSETTLLLLFLVVVTGFPEAGWHDQATVARVEFSESSGYALSFSCFSPCFDIAHLDEAETHFYVDSDEDSFANVTGAVFGKVFLSPDQVKRCQGRMLTVVSFQSQCHCKMSMIFDTPYRPNMVASPPLTWSLDADASWAPGAFYRGWRKLPISHPGKNVLPLIRQREELGWMLQAEGKHVGVEVGVRNGFFAQDILRRWTLATSYSLVDVWAEVKHNSTGQLEVLPRDFFHEEVFHGALFKLRHWADQISVVRGDSVEMAARFDDASLDFVYLDAAHDYDTVRDELASYWPKLSKGGIIAGHDYNTEVSSEGASARTKSGSIELLAVVGAVQEFALEHGLPALASYAEPFLESMNMEQPASWYLRKPY